jgi:hypothetical protein
MPFDPRLQYRDEVKKEKGGKTGRLKTRWEKIVDVLSRKIENPEELIVREVLTIDFYLSITSHPIKSKQQAHVDLLTTTTKNPHDQFFGLKMFFKKFFSKEETEDFFTNLLPKIQQLVRPDPFFANFLYCRIHTFQSMNRHSLCLILYHIKSQSSTRARKAK